ncbi:MAG: ATP-binding protein [Vicinamibacterales bacterium]
MPPPSSLDDAARLAERRNFEVLDTAADADLDALAALAAHVCGVGMAAVSLVDGDWHRVKARYGFPFPEESREAIFCAHTVQQDGVYEVPDAAADPRFAASALVTGPPYVAFYAGAPLTTDAGQTIGALCVIDRQPRRLGTEQRQTLALLARQVTRRLEHQRGVRALQRASEEGRAHADDMRRAAEAAALNEQRMTLVLNSLGAGYFDWDMSSGLVTFDPRFAGLLHLHQPSPQPPDIVFAAIDDPELAELHTALADLFAGRATRVQLQFAVRSPDSDPRWVRLHCDIAVRTPAGDPLRTIGLLVDITHDHQRDDQLRTAQKLDAIGTLAAGVAHEINTPLQFVSHNLDFVASEIGELGTTIRAAAPDADEHPWRDVELAVAESIEGLERVTEIVRALKEFSHNGRGGRERVDINQMVQNAITLTRNEWRNAATVERHLAPGLPPIAAASNECGQVLINLIVNAAHAIQAATRPGQRGLIGITTRLVDGQVEIRVADNGTGIGPEIQPRIFEPFFTTKAVGRGSGQGLATAKAVVERYGGTIGFETEVGLGATFIVRFPVLGAASQAA